MFRPQFHLPAEPRRGVILLVVVALLTLFAIVGLSFVLYAEAEARLAQTAREVENPSQPDGDPELLMSFFLGQLLYDVPDPTPGNEWGPYSALRGHSLARLMYGGNDDPNQPNDRAFTGVGRLHTTANFNPAQDRFPIMHPFGGRMSNPDDYNLDQLYVLSGRRVPPRPGTAWPTGQATASWQWYAVVLSPAADRKQSGLISSIYVRSDRPRALCRRV